MAGYRRSFFVQIQKTPQNGLYVGFFTLCVVLFFLRVTDTCCGGFLKEARIELQANNILYDYVHISGKSQDFLFLASLTIHFIVTLHLGCVLIV